MKTAHHRIISIAVALAAGLALSAAPFAARVYADASTTPASGTASSTAPASGDAAPADVTVDDTNAATTAATTTATAATGGNTASATEGNAAIATGDAAATADSENDANATIVTASTTPASGTASSTPAASTTPALAVTDTNAATTTATTTVAATTGGNTASSTGGAATVATGDAYASANATNIVNTNIIDSSGLLYFANLFSALGIDLRSLDLSYLLGGAGGGNALVSADNAATVANALTVVANTGGNTASSTGDALVATGDAYASGNAVNLVNSNLVQSRYLLVGVNDFGNLSGDLTLPAASFFEQLLANGIATPLSVSTDNTATLNDTTAAAADTGSNAATSTGGAATVATGNALSSATTLNQVNTTQVGGTTVYLLFHIFGDWSGSVEGLPPGLAWRQTPEGVEITNASGTPATPAELGSASTTNTANLANSAHVYALTGGNEASGGSAAVSTGNAYAAANTINIVNTNLIGANWIYAIFNIFGNFSGNIAFGHPDLWVGVSADAGNPTLPGARVPFRFTVMNRGDAAATNVRLTTGFLADMLRFATGSSTPSTASWNLGTLAPGQAAQITADATAGNLPQGYSENVPITASVTSDETDDDPADNTDHLALFVTNPNPPGGATITSDPKVAVTKTEDVSATTSPATVNYAVVVKNTGGTAYRARATDILRDPAGNIVSRQQFDLGTLGYHEGTKITYAVGFDASTTPGLYTNVVTVTGYMHYASGPGSFPMPPVYATSTLTILPPAGRVAAAPAPDPVCAPYLTGYVTPGAANDPAEVRRLQEFLISTAGDAGVSVTGVYDPATIAAVKRFQSRYVGDILGPWGYDRPTGDVYYTTQQKINDLVCAGRRSFSLSRTQLAEIAGTRARLAALRSAATQALSTATPPTASTTASTSEPALPQGIEVGLATPPAPVPARAHSWIDWLTGLQRTVLAGVAGSFSSIGGLVSLR